MFKSRAPRWAFTLLDEADRPIGVLDGVEGGKVKLAALSRLGGSGELSIRDVGQEIDWMKHRVQAVYDPGIPGVAGWPVATMLFTSPTETHSEFGVGYRVSLLTKMVVVDEDTTEDFFSLAAGTPIIDAVVALLVSTGETRVAVTPSDVVLGAAYTADPGTSKLSIINELLQTAGYWSLWCDGAGQFRVEPYVNPGSRPVVYEFTEGAAAVHFPEWERVQDLSSVPNRFVAVGRGSDDTPPLVGVAENVDPGSPFSFVSRGRWITATDEGVEAASQEVIDQIAQRRLLDAMTPVSRIEATHAILPLSPNELIRFAPASGARLATIMNMEMDFTSLSQCKAEWREVTGG